MIVIFHCHHFLCSFVCFNHSFIQFHSVTFLDFTLTWVLDAKESNSSFQEQRVFYVNSGNSYTETRTVSVQKNDENFCFDLNAYVKVDVFFFFLLFLSNLCQTLKHVCRHSKDRLTTALPVAVNPENLH